MDWKKLIEEAINTLEMAQDDQNMTDKQYNKINDIIEQLNNIIDG